MAKWEHSFYGDFDQSLHRLEDGILGGSVSATLEQSSDFRGASGSRCSVRVFERYSYIGGNRLSLNVVLFQEPGGPIYLSAVTAGGSRAVFFKINTFGEETFLEKLVEIFQ